MTSAPTSQHPRVEREEIASPWTVTHSSVAGAGSSVGTAVRERLASLATPIARPRATVPTTAHRTRTRTQEWGSPRYRLWVGRERSNGMAAWWQSSESILDGMAGSSEGRGAGGGVLGGGAHVCGYVLGMCGHGSERTEYGGQSPPRAAGRAGRGGQAGPRPADLGCRGLSHEEVPGRAGEGVEVRVREGRGGHVPGGGAPAGPGVRGDVVHLHARGRDDATGGRRRRRRGRGRGAQPRTPVERRVRPSAAAVKLRAKKHTQNGECGEVCVG